MGLDIFPNSSAQPAAAASGGGCTHPSSTGTESRQHGHAVAKEGGRSGAAQGETEFRETLENFLFGFEQEIHGCAAAEEQTAGRSQARSLAAKQQPAGTSPLVRLRPRRASACSACHSKLEPSRKKSVPKKPPKRGRKRKKDGPLPQKPKKAAPLGGPDVGKLHAQDNPQLRKMPVVRLGRRGPLPDRMILQGQGLQSLADTKVSDIPTHPQPVRTDVPQVH